MHMHIYFLCYHPECGCHVTTPNQGLSLGTEKSLGMRLNISNISIPSLEHNLGKKCSLLALKKIQATYKVYLFIHFFWMGRPCIFVVQQKKLTFGAIFCAALFTTHLGRIPETTSNIIVTNQNKTRLS